MRKSLWKVVALVVVLALGAMVLSAAAADQPGKAATCSMSAGKAAPAEMKSCTMTATAVGDGKGGCRSGDAKSACTMDGKGGRCCGMQACGGSCGSMAAKGHERRCMQGGMMSCGAKGSADGACCGGRGAMKEGCGMQGGGQSCCRMARGADGAGCCGRGAMKGSCGVPGGAMKDGAMGCGERSAVMSCRVKCSGDGAEGIRRVVVVKDGPMGRGMGADAPMACGMGPGGHMGCGMGPGGHSVCGMAPAGAMGCDMGPGGAMGCSMGSGGHMGCGMGMGCDPGQMKEIGLTPDQQKRMVDIHERLERQRIQTGADLRIAQLDLQKLMRAENPDRAQVEAQIDRIAALEATMKKARFATQLEARSILTPEQVRRMHEGPGACGAREEKPAKPVKAGK